MAISWYATKHIFGNNPATLEELRATQMDKLQTLDKEGSFALTMDPGDGQPLLVVSWTGDADKKDYWTKLVKAKKVVKGKFKTTKTGLYTFTPTDPKDAVLKEYLALPNNALSIAFWNLIGGKANVININGTALTQRSLVDADWTLAEWRVAHVMVTNDTLFPKAPIAAHEVTQDGKKAYATKNGLVISADFVITVKVHGKMASKAEANPHSAAYIRDPTTEVVRPLVKALADTLNKLDASLGTEQDPAKKLLVAKAGNEAVAKFKEDAIKAITAKATEQWIKLLDARVDYRDYQVDMAVQITVGSIQLVVGVVVAGVGGVTGVGAILGLVGTIKGGLETATTVYTVLRSSSGLGDEINTQLGKALLLKGDEAGWANFGKAVLGNVPGGQPFQALLAKAGAAVKSAEQIEKDLKAYKGKVSGELMKASSLGKTVPAALNQSQTALAALDAKEVKEKEKDPAVKKRNDALRAALGKGTTDLLNQIGDLSKGADEGLEKAKGYEVLLKTLKEETDKNKISKALTQYFVPLLNLPWGVDPTNVATTVMGAGSVALDMLNPVLDELKASEQTKQIAGYVKNANDLATALTGLVKTVKGG